jgi:hypothetical protein
MTLICATNLPDMLPPHLRKWPCTFPEVHKTTCMDDLCTGCAPRPADRGMLCQHCFEKLDNALNKFVALVVHLRSIDSAGSSDAERVSSSLAWRLPVPQSWLAADELLEVLGAEPIPSTATLDEARAHAAMAVARWGDPETAVSNTIGALRAIEFFRRMQTTLHRWPEEESERTMPAPLRCQNCHQLTLIRKPAIEYLGSVEVVCPSCGHVHDWWAFLNDASSLVASVVAAQKAAAQRARRERNQL